MIGANEVNVSREGMRRMATDRNLKDDSHRVLMHIIGNVGHLNWIRISPVEIAGKLQLEPFAVASHIKDLSDLGYLSKKGQLGELDLYRLSHEIAWKGTFDELEYEFPDDL